MIDANGTFRLGVLAHWVAVIFGIIAGFWLFGLANLSLFVANSGDTLFSILGIVLGGLTLLPLSILAIFKPRLAAYCITLSFVGSMLCLSQDVLSYPGERMGASELLLFSLKFVMPPCLVAALLFYGASVRDAVPMKGSYAHRESSEAGPGTRVPLPAEAATIRKKQAHAVAVILGLIAGTAVFHWGLYWVAKCVREGDWLGVMGITAMALTLLPLSFLGIFRPRIAAYGILSNMAVVLAYFVFLSKSPPFGSLEIFARVTFSLFVCCPFAVMARMLIYSSDGHQQ